MNNGPFKPVEGTMAWYLQDSGADIATTRPMPVIAPVPMTLLYSEGLMSGDTRHTGWVPCKAYPKDTPGCILARLEKPLAAHGNLWPLMWFCHLSQLAHHIRDYLDAPLKVGAGHVLGLTGWGRGNLHLHFGILTARQQGPGQYMNPKEVATLVNSWPLWKGQAR